MPTVVQRRWSIVRILATIVLPGLLVAGFALHADNELEYQQRRNALLEQEIAKLDKQTREVSTINRERERFLARAKLLQEIALDKGLNTLILVELTETQPDGVALHALSRRGRRLVLEGEAISAHEVETYARRIEASAWLQSPALEVLEAGERRGVTRFTLRADVTMARQLVE